VNDHVMPSTRKNIHLAPNGIGLIVSENDESEFHGS
jgi:hypothetical protein